MQNVREAVDTKRQWMHSQMQVADTLPKHADPPIKCVQISAEQKVGHNFLRMCVVLDSHLIVCRLVSGIDSWELFLGCPVYTWLPLLFPWYCEVSTWFI